MVVCFGSAAVTVSVMPSGRGSACIHPAVLAVHLTRMLRQHALDRSKGAAGAGDRNSDAAVDSLDRGVRVQRDFVHVDQMHAQRIEVHLRPVGGGIGLQHGDDLLHRTERVLTRLRRQRSRRALHAGHVHRHAHPLHRHVAVHRRRVVHALCERCRTRQRPRDDCQAIHRIAGLLVRSGDRH